MISCAENYERLPVSDTLRQSFPNARPERRNEALDPDWESRRAWVTGMW
jgi:hypothetical protein